MSNTIDIRLREIRYWIQWLAAGMSAGGWASRYLGRGFDYQGTAPYRDDPDLVRINWQASLIEGELIVNTFSEERSIDVFVLADLNRAMLFGSEETKVDRIAELAAILAFSAARAKDRFELIGYSGGVRHRFPRFSSERGYPLRLAEAILRFDYSDGKRGGLIQAVGPIIGRPRSLVLVISDFLGDLDEVRRAMSLVAFKHDVVPVVLWDKRELVLPQGYGIVPIHDLGSGDLKHILLTPRVRKRHAQNVADRKREIKAAFGCFGVRPFLLSAVREDDVQALVKIFLRRRVQV